MLEVRLAAQRTNTINLLEKCPFKSKQRPGTIRCSGNQITVKAAAAGVSLNVEERVVDKNFLHSSTEHKNKFESSDT